MSKPLAKPEQIEAHLRGLLNRAQKGDVPARHFDQPGEAYKAGWVDALRESLSGVNDPEREAAHRQFVGEDHRHAPNPRRDMGTARRAGRGTSHPSTSGGNR